VSWVGAFWEFYIARAAEILIGLIISGVRNIVFFLVAITSIYQAQRINALHTRLVSLNTPFYEGGQVAFPVADESELKMVNNLAGRAALFGVAALVFSVMGWWLQFRRDRKLHRLANNTLEVPR